MMKFKILHFIQEDKPGDSPEGIDGFFQRIESVAATYANTGSKIISLSFLEEQAFLFIQERSER